MHSSNIIVHDITISIGPTTIGAASSYCRLHTSVFTIGRKSRRAVTILQRSPRKFVYAYNLLIRSLWTAHFLRLNPLLLRPKIIGRKQQFGENYS